MNVRPVVFSFARVFSSIRNGSTINNFWPIIDSTFWLETILPVIFAMNIAVGLQNLFEF
jgi:hypothetical protein